MTEEKKVEKVEEIEIKSDTPVVEEKIVAEKDVIKDIPVKDVVSSKKRGTGTANIEGWKPKTGLGKNVKEGVIKDIDEILDKGAPIMEAEIVDTLITDLKNELLLIGQSKGKFGGGARRIFKQTQKKTPEGNKPSFASAAVVGNENGYIGIGFGKSKDTVPAREKAIRLAKLNLFKIRRGCGSWECNCKNPHSIPIEVEGKCGSVSIKLMPAPKGKGLCVEKECQKILKLAGINDVWSKTSGQTRVKTNLIKALIKALKKLSQIKFSHAIAGKVGLVDGKIKENAENKTNE